MPRVCVHMCEWVWKVREKECRSVFSLAGIKSVRGGLTRVVQICLSAQRPCLSCLSNPCQETTTCHHSVVCAFHGSGWVMSSGVVGGPENWTIITDSGTCSNTRWEIVLHGEETRSGDLDESETESGRKINLVLTLSNTQVLKVEQFMRPFPETAPVVFHCGVKTIVACFFKKKNNKFCQTKYFQYLKSDFS